MFRYPINRYNPIRFIQALLCISCFSCGILEILDKTPDAYTAYILTVIAAVFLILCLGDIIRSAAYKQFDWQTWIYIALNGFVFFCFTTGVYCCKIGYFGFNHLPILGCTLLNFLTAICFLQDYFYLITMFKRRKKDQHRTLEDGEKFPLFNVCLKRFKKTPHKKLDSCYDYGQEVIIIDERQSVESMEPEEEPTTIVLKETLPPIIIERKKQPKGEEETESPEQSKSVEPPKVIILKDDKPQDERTEIVMQEIRQTKPAWDESRMERPMETHIEHRPMESQMELPPNSQMELSTESQIEHLRESKVRRSSVTSQMKRRKKSQVETPTESIMEVPLETRIDQRSEPRTGGRSSRTPESSTRSLARKAPEDREEPRRRMERKLCKGGDGRMYLSDGTALYAEITPDGETYYRDPYGILYDVEGHPVVSNKGKRIMVETLQQDVAHYLDKQTFSHIDCEVHAADGTLIPRAAVCADGRMFLPDGQCLRKIVTPSGVTYYETARGVLYTPDGTPYGIIDEQYTDTETADIQKHEIPGQVIISETVIRERVWDVSPWRKESVKVCPCPRIQVSEQGELSLLDGRALTQMETESGRRIYETDDGDLFNQQGVDIKTTVNVKKKTSARKSIGRCRPMRFTPSERSEELMSVKLTTDKSSLLAEAFKGRQKDGCPGSCPKKE